MLSTVETRPSRYTSRAGACCLHSDRVNVAAYAWYCGLGLVQGVLVALPRAPRAAWLTILRRHWLLFVGPIAAVTAATFLPRVATELAGDLATLALFAVPLLAALALLWTRPGHPALTVTAVALCLLAAWKGTGQPVGEAAALALVGLSAVAVAMAVVAVVPTRVVKVGIGLWAIFDLSLALSHRLAEASQPIVRAAPVVGPHLQFQRVVLGSASMEWADLFLAAALGAALAVQGRRRRLASLLVAVLAMSFSVFFLLTDVLPATVPVALALVVEEGRVWLRSRAGRGAARGSAVSRNGMEVPARAVQAASRSRNAVSAHSRASERAKTQP
jgi:hypothetical protein